jgi:hypothetical protein
MLHMTDPVHDHILHADRGPRLQRFLRSPECAANAGHDLFDYPPRGEHLVSVTTVAEIEAAIARLPPEQWEEIRRWMDAHAPSSLASEALEAFRQLQAEVGLSSERATAWKDAVAAGRR